MRIMFRPPRRRWCGLKVWQLPCQAELSLVLTVYREEESMSETFAVDVKGEGPGHSAHVGFSSKVKSNI